MVANYLNSFNVTPPSAAPIANALANVPEQFRKAEQQNWLRQRNELSMQKMKFDIARANRQDQLKAFEWLGQASLAASDDPQKQKMLIKQASEMFGTPIDESDLASAKMHVQGALAAKNYVSPFEREKFDLEKQYKLAQIAKMKKEGTGGNGVYGTPIYGTDENGNVTLGVITKDGQFKRLDTGTTTPTPGVTFQNFGTYRQGFGKGGQPLTPRIPTQGTVEPGYRQGGGLTAGGAPISVEPVPGSKAAGAVAESASETAAKERGKATVSGFTLRDARVVQSTIPELSNNAIVRLAKAKIPGTPEYKAATYLESLKGTISIEQLLNIKRQGAGLGQVPQAQLNLLARLMGELTLGLDKSDLTSLVKDIQDTYIGVLRDMSPKDRKIVGIADREYRRLVGKEQQKQDDPLGIR
jgi:hypothetical protein